MHVDVPGKPGESAERLDRALLRDVGGAVAAQTVSPLGVFLVGALAVQIRSSLHFGPGALGLTVSTYYLGATLGAVPFGRLADAVGGARVMRVAVPATSLVLAAIAVLARSWGALTAVLFVAGLVSSSMQPATNRFLARRIPVARQGLAFGVKQAAVPTAMVLGGLAVPAIALTVGWRWAFAAGALLAFGVAAVLPRPNATVAAVRAARPPQDGHGSRLPLVVLAVGFGMGIFASLGLTAFLVSSAVAAGISKGDAGLLAALAGGCAVATRVATGARADRRGRAHFPVAAAMLAVGVVGYCALALGSARHLAWLFVAGSVVAYGVGWGWNGLFNFAVVHAFREAPGRASGVTQVGARLAGLAGPVLVGVIVTHLSYAAAWLVAGGMAGTGAAVILLGNRLLAGSGREGPGPP